MGCFRHLFSLFVAKFFQRMRLEERLKMLKGKNASVRAVVESQEAETDFEHYKREVRICCCNRVSYSQTTLKWTLLLWLCIHTCGQYFFSWPDAKLSIPTECCTLFSLPLIRRSVWRERAPDGSHCQSPDHMKEWPHVNPILDPRRLLILMISTFLEKSEYYISGYESTRTIQRGAAKECHKINLWI